MGDLGRLRDQLAERIPNGRLSLALGASAFLSEVIEELDRLKCEWDEARRERDEAIARAEAAEREMMRVAEELGATRVMQREADARERRAAEAAYWARGMPWEDDRA